jgi:hypothetical protein
MTIFYFKGVPGSGKSFIVVWLAGDLSSNNSN